MNRIKKVINQIKRFIDRTAHFVPVILLIISFTAVFINYHSIKNGSTLLGNTTGYSLIVDYAFLRFYTFRRYYCYLVRLSPIGLIVINIIDIIACFFDDDFYDLYSFWYTVIVSAIVWGLIIVLEIRKKLNK